MVGGKVGASRFSPSVMPCFWVVFTGFLGLLRHGCGGLVGWQMVLSGRSGSSDRSPYLRGFVGLCLVVSGRCLGRGELGREIRGILALVDGIWGQKSIFRECAAHCACVLVGVLGCWS